MDQVGIPIHAKYRLRDCPTRHIHLLTRIGRFGVGTMT